MKRYLFLMAATACMLSCAGNGDSGNGVELLDAAAFRTKIDGKPVGLYTLQNADGMTVQLTNYGARVVALWVPAADGRFRDVVWGYDSIDAYLRTADKYCGPVVGRFGNRIGKGYTRRLNIELSRKIAGAVAEYAWDLYRTGTQIKHTYSFRISTDPKTIAV